MNSTTPKVFPIPRKSNTEHFIRPKDVHFAKEGESGVFPQLPSALNRFVPEDLLHNSQLVFFANLAECDWSELPVRPMNLTYEIRPDRYYPIWKHGEAKGYIKVDSSAEKVVIHYWKNDDQGVPRDHLYDLEYATWNTELNRMGFLIAPLISRSGACCLIRGQIGCIIKNNGAEFNFDHRIEKLVYNVLVGANEVAEVSFEETLSSLLPIGTVLYVVMNVLGSARLISAHRAAIHRGRLLKVRLDVPDVQFPVDGKVFVTYTETACSGNTTCNTVQVNPWDLHLESSVSSDSLAVRVVEEIPCDQ